MEHPNTTASTQMSCGISHTTREVAIASLYFLLFPPALLLNVLVAWICTHLKSKSTFMVYLKHLVAADLLLTLTLPLRAANELPGASHGLQAFCCQFAHVLFYLALNMSVILMGLISLDRFFKIVRPGGRLLCQNLLFSKVLSALFWILLIVTNSMPVILTTNEDPTNKTGELCMAMKSQTGLLLHNGVVMVGEVIFWTVCVVIVICYTCIAKKVVESLQKSRSSNEQKKRKAKVRVFLILLVFLICYVPYHLVRIPYTKLQVNTKDSCTRAALKIAKDVGLWLSASNVGLDPLIYFFLCKAFRQKFLESCNFKRFCPSVGKTVDTQSSETSM